MLAQPSVEDGINLEAMECCRVCATTDCLSARPVSSLRNALDFCAVHSDTDDEKVFPLPPRKQIARDTCVTTFHKKVVFTILHTRETSTLIHI